VTKKAFSPTFLLYILLSIFYLFTLWIIKPQDTVVFFLWIISIISIVLRVRLHNNVNLMTIDVLFFFILTQFFNEASLLMIPVVLLGVFKLRKEAFIFLALIVLFYIRFDIEKLLLVSLSFISVFVISQWEYQRIEHFKELDFSRQRHYRLEREKDLLIASQDELSRISVLSERDRIAQTLHDDLGHELTASLLALRAFETLNKDVVGNQSFITLKTRLEKAITSLKETILHTKPNENYGFDRFKALIDDFEPKIIKFTHQGNLLELSETHYYLLTSVLKEALTNIQKHANPTIIEINLTTDEPVVRLIIKNDGVRKDDNQRGFGLMYMRKKVEALGGHLTVQKSFNFTLYCILPCHLESEERL